MGAEGTVSLHHWLMVSFPKWATGSSEVEFLCPLDPGVARDPQLSSRTPSLQSLITFTSARPPGISRSSVCCDEKTNGAPGLGDKTLMWESILPGDRNARHPDSVSGDPN